MGGFLYLLFQMVLRTRLTSPQNSCNEIWPKLGSLFLETELETSETGVIGFVDRNDDDANIEVVFRHMQSAPWGKYQNFKGSLAWSNHYEKHLTDAEIVLLLLIKNAVNVWEKEPGEIENTRLHTIWLLRSKKRHPDIWKWKNKLYQIRCCLRRGEIRHPWSDAKIENKWIS